MKLNLDTITVDAYMSIYNLDKTFIGTPHYMGVAFFWAHDYRHTGIRELSYFKCRKIHRLILKAGCAPDDVNPVIEDIIKKEVK